MSSNGSNLKNSNILYIKKVIFDWILSFGEFANHSLPAERGSTRPEHQISLSFQDFGRKKQQIYQFEIHVFVKHHACRKYIQCTYNYRNKDNHENAPKSQVYILDKQKLDIFYKQERNQIHFKLNIFVQLSNYQKSNRQLSTSTRSENEGQPYLSRPL